MEESEKKERIKKITHLYYSKPEVQKAIYEFCKNREVCPRYYDGFGKRPDSLQYIGDIYELVKRGATSFNCSEEIWEEPLKIATGMTEKEYNEIRIGWDLLIDIDCKWFYWAHKVAEVIVESLEELGVKNVGIKFSGSKGFHILIPLKSFPKEINCEKTSDKFPELPRKIIAYLREYSQKNFKKKYEKEIYSEFENTPIKKGVKCKNCEQIAQVYEQIKLYCQFCRREEIKKIDENSEKEIYKCPECGRELMKRESKEIYECTKCVKNSIKNPDNFLTLRTEEMDLFEIMGLDLILVSPRHLFRTPYSLHEKTALASIVLTKNELKNFQMKDANPMNIKIKDFNPDSKEGEANKLVMQALDWAKNKEIKDKGNKQNIKGEFANFKKINLKNLKEEDYPPSIKKILKGVGDGRKRALFILINFFRSTGMEKEELEKKIGDWNKKNEVALKEGYIAAQLFWAYRREPILPPNFNTDYYRGIGVIPSIEEMKLKNPVNWVIKKNSSAKNK